MDFVVMFAVVVLVYALVGVALVRRYRRPSHAEASWLSLGQRLGLTLSNDAFAGTIYGFAVAIRRGAKLGSKTTTPWTLATISGGLPVGARDIAHTGGPAEAIAAGRAGWKLRRGVLELEVIGVIVGDLVPRVTLGLVAARALRERAS